MSTTAGTSVTIQQVVDRLVGQTEIADRLHVKRVTVERWRQRHDDFPKPVAIFSATPVWWWPNVKLWHDNRPANRAAALAEADHVAPGAPPSRSMPPEPAPRTRMTGEPLVQHTAEGDEIVVTDSPAARLCQHPKKRAVAGGAVFVCTDCGLRL